MVVERLSSKKSRFAVVSQIICFALVIFTLLRTALLLRIWPDADHHVLDLLYIFGVGLVYDFAYLGYVSIPFVLFLMVLPNKWINSRHFTRISQIAVYMILTCLFFNCVAEWLFWDEFGVRFNFIAVDYLVYRQEVTDNILESYHVPWLLVNIFFVTTSVFMVLRKIIIPSTISFDTFSQRMLKGAGILLIPVAAFLFIGQSQHNLSDNNYVNELASNGSYQLFAAFRNNTLNYQQFYALGKDQVLSEKLKKQVQEPNISFENNQLYNIARNIEVKAPENRLNVILISVESLSADFLTRFGNKDDITPFMDSLIPQGLLFTNFYATGTRTTRGLEAITLSIPPTPGRSIVKRPNNDHMYSLGKVFKDHDYDATYLYGGRGYFENMNAFFSGNGYRTVDQTDFKKEDVTFKNAWGVADEDLYRRTIREANQVYGSGKPFFFHVMTTSNHRPYTYPDGKIDIPSRTGGRRGGVKYADYALSQLIKEAEKQPWFADTMFVIVADHCASSAGKVGLPIEKYHIPMFVYSPKHIAPGEIDTLSSQIDLAPTLLSMLHFSYESFFFGKDILSPDFKGRALIANYQKLGFYNGKELLILSPRKEIDLISTESNRVVTKKIEVPYPLVGELMSFYQGADYILKNRLNRWVESKSFASKGSTLFDDIAL